MVNTTKVHNRKLENYFNFKKPIQTFLQNQKLEHYLEGKISYSVLKLEF